MQRYLAVFGACLTQFTIIGLLFSYGVFFTTFEAEFGWSRTLLSSASSISMFMMGVIAIFGGRLSDRFGPRIVLLCTGLCYGAGYMALSLIGAPWQLLLLFATLIPLGMGTHDVVTLSTIARWFDRRRGLMTAVAKVGTAIGQMVVPPLVAFLIGWLGWRDAVLGLGLAAAALLVVAAMSMSLPAQPKGAAPKPMEGLTYAEAKAGRPFWTVCAVQFLFFPTLTTVPLHIVPHATDLGLTAPVAATLLSISGAASVAGRLTIGAFSDRIGGRRSYFLCLTPIFLSLIALIFIDEAAPLFFLMALYGFGHGGLFTVVSPTVAELFGLRAHGAIFGMVLFFGTVGGAIGPILAGRAFDLLGGYDIAFGVLAGMVALAALLVATLPRRA